jgi:hypothetical protein
MVVSGTSGSGKTEWTRKLLLSDLVRPVAERILWCYGQWQPLYDTLQRTIPRIEFVQGIPNYLNDSQYIILTPTKGIYWFLTKYGPYEFFYSFGNSPESYGVEFENILNKKYLRNTGKLQQFSSNVCSLYYAYYVIKRYQGKTLKRFLKFDIHERKRNDRLIVSTMRKKDAMLQNK